MKAELAWSYTIDSFSFETYNDRPDFDFIELDQTHSNTVLIDEEIDISNTGDGIISTCNSPLCIKTADCLPIGIIGHKGIANIHAGWRGLQREILNNQRILQIQPHTVIIGPHIGPSNYEVGHEFLDIFKNELITKEKRFYLSLGTIAKKQIARYFGNIEVISSELCTFKDDNLNSYRRNKTNKRNYNILRKK